MPKRKITKPMLNKVLKEASFDPRGDRALGIILDIGTSDYFGSRAIEHITESLTQPYKETRKSMLRAIRVLALGILVLDSYSGTTKKPKKRASRSKNTRSADNISEET